MLLHFEMKSGRYYVLLEVESVLLCKMLSFFLHLMVYLFLLVFVSQCKCFQGTHKKLFTLKCAQPVETIIFDTPH